MKIALVHDWLTESGENEKVLPSLLELFPGADLFTLVYRPERFEDLLGNRRVTTSFLQRLPTGKTHPFYFLPFYWELMRGLDLSTYDLIVSNSSACAKWIKPTKGSMHVCYLQSPLRGLWKEGPVESPFPKWELSLFRNYLRRCDLKSNEGVTHFLAGSDAAQGFIQQVYGREAFVIPPPFDAKFSFKMQVYFRRLYGINVNEENLKV